MNDKPEQNQMTKERWEELCLQHAAQAMMLGDLRHEVRLLRVLVLALAQAQGHTLKLEDHTEPASGERQGMEYYAELLKLARQGAKESPPQG